CVPHAFACPRALRRGCTVRAGGPRWPGARGRGGIPAWARGSVGGRGSLLILVSSRRTCKRRLGFGPVAATSIPPNPPASLVPDLSIIQGHPSLLIAFSDRALRWHPVCSLGGGKQLDDSLRLRGIRTRTVWVDRLLLTKLSLRTFVTGPKPVVIAGLLRHRDFQAQPRVALPIVLEPSAKDHGK